MTDENVSNQVISKKFLGILKVKVTEVKSRIWIRISNPVVRIHETGSRSTSVSKRYRSGTLVGTLE
jgi:hypothetical protein